jgi:hypothetical protein
MTYSAFADELEKIADMMIGKETDPIVAGGLFVSGGQKEAERAQQLLSEKGSIQKARAQFRKEFPKAYTTTAFSRQAAPKGARDKWWKIWKSKKPDPGALKSYEDRKKSPRIFLRAGPAGGYQQKAFYNEVARGLRDNELSQPWVKNKKVYT